MAHIFIAPTAISSPRWQQAFGSVQIVSCVDEVGKIATDDVLWLLLDDNWQALDTCVATGARVIALTACEDPLQAQRALELGACGYVHYLAVAEVLRQVDQVVRHGGLWLGADLMRKLVLASGRLGQNISPDQNISPGIAHKISPDVAPNIITKDPLVELTPRESAVAKAVAAGKSNKEVARLLDITERTVKAHLSAVFTKLGVRDRLHLALTLSGQRDQ